MIRALIFDFDGLILETEGPIYQSWQELYREFGCELSFEAWGKIIGTAPATFDPFADLEVQYGKPVDRTSVAPKRQQRELDLIYAQPVLPGVEALLEAARRRSLLLGVASSSSRDWVEGHLARLGLHHYFHTVKTSNDVLHTKPDPELYLAVLEELDLQPQEAIVFEDSPNGIRAAREAGIFVVCVPNELTRRLDTNGASLHLQSLAGLALDDLIRQVEEKQQENG